MIDTCVGTAEAAAWTLPVVSSTTQLVLRSDNAVDGGVGPLCRGPDEKPKGFDEGGQRTHKMPGDFSVHQARVHGVCAHTQNCGQQQALCIKYWGTANASHNLFGELESHCLTFCIFVENIPITMCFLLYTNIDVRTRIKYLNIFYLL